MQGKVIIVGPAASGKDTLRKRFEKKGYIYGMPYTTRPKRDGETYFDYFFVSEKDFEKISKYKGFAVKNSYNNWKYGITNETLENSDVFVMTPEYISQLDKDFIKKSFIIYINPPENVRKERLSNRNDADTVERRLNADREQFANFTNYDLMITNSEF